MPPRSRKRAPRTTVAKDERDHLTVQLKTYVTSDVADMVRQRRGDLGLSEAAYMRRLALYDLGLIKKEGA